MEHKYTSREIEDMAGRYIYAMIKCDSDFIKAAQEKLLGYKSIVNFVEAIKLAEEDRNDKV